MMDPTYVFPVVAATCLGVCVCVFVIYGCSGYMRRT